MMSDNEILAALAKGDDRVLEALYKQVLPKVRSYVLKNSGTGDDASNVFQDAVVVFYKHVKTRKFNTEHDQRLPESMRTELEMSALIDRYLNG